MSFPSKKKLRSSGILFSFLFAAIFGLLPFLLHNETRITIFIISLLILVLSFVSPYSLRVPYSFWIKFGTMLGKFNSNVILFLFFYFFLTPFAILRKLFFLFNFNTYRKKQSFYAKPDFSSKTNLKDQF